MTIDDHDLFSEFEKLYWKTSREISFLWKKIYEQTFPGSQSHILFLLQRNGPQKMSELAKALHLTRGAITTASDQLIEQGYIARKRDQNDRRVIFLNLTKQGRETLKELQIKGQKAMKLVFKDLSDDDLETLMIIFNQANLRITEIGKEYNL